MKCPFCKKTLIRGEDKEFETLLDHVSNPNAIKYPPRETFVCSCIISHDCFWDIDGAFYIGSNANVKLILSDRHSHDAIGSWWRWAKISDRVSSYLITSPLNISYKLSKKIGNLVRSLFPEPQYPHPSLRKI